MGTAGSSSRRRPTNTEILEVLELLRASATVATESTFEVAVAYGETLDDPCVEAAGGGDAAPAAAQHVTPVRAPPATPPTYSAYRVTVSGGKTVTLESPPHRLAWPTTRLLLASLTSPADLARHCGPLTLLMADGTRLPVIIAPPLYTSPGAQPFAWQITVASLEQFPAFQITLSEEDSTGHLNWLLPQQCGGIRRLNAQTYMRFVDEVCAACRVHKCDLEDAAKTHIIDGNPIQFSPRSPASIPLSLVFLLKGRNTYYQQYGFVPSSHDQAAIGTFKLELDARPMRREYSDILGERGSTRSLREVLNGLLLTAGKTTAELANAAEQMRSIWADAVGMIELIKTYPVPGALRVVAHGGGGGGGGGV